MSPPRRRRGFTLVEAIAAIVVIATLGAMGTRLVFTALQALRDGADRSTLQSQLSQAMEFVTRQLRQMPATSGVPQITSVGAGSIAFRGGAESFTVDAGQLRYTNTAIGVLGAVVLDGVTAVEFRGFGEANQDLGTSLDVTTGAAVRRIGVTITAARNGRSETLRSKVYLRACMQGAAQ